MRPCYATGVAAVVLCIAGVRSASAQRAADLVAYNASVVDTSYSGRRAVRVLPNAGAENATSYAIVKNSSLQDGTIEVDIAGRPAAGAFADARGFIGVGFRLRDGRYEYVYLRPTNGRANDQVRRNHSTQYSSYPDFDYAKSRAEAPGKFESYVDLEPGVWTKYRLEIAGRTARLFVHDAAQSCLIVNDLRLDPAPGAVMLWVGPGTEGYFANLKITPSAAR